MSVYALPLDSSGIAPGGESRGYFLMSDLYFSCLTLLFVANILLYVALH